MISKEQLADEQRKEREYNKLFEAVIAKSPFGQWYPLMIGASNLLTQNLKKRVGIDEDGRPIVVYKSEVGKVMGTWAVPVHQVIAKNISQKKWVDVLSDIFTSGTVSQIKTIQKQKKAKFFDISPKEVGEVHNRKVALKKQSNKVITPDDVKVPIVDDKNTSYSPFIF